MTVSELESGYWHCPHRVMLGRHCVMCAAIRRIAQAVQRRDPPPQQPPQGDTTMIDRTLHRLSVEDQERSGRDTPEDLNPHAIRVLVSQLLAMGCDVEPHSDLDLDCDCVSVTCDQESADDVVGMHGGARETLPGGYLARISWPEAPWPITGKELAALWEENNG